MENYFELLFFFSSDFADNQFVFSDLPYEVSFTITVETKAGMACEVFDGAHEKGSGGPGTGLGLSPSEDGLVLELFLGDRHVPRGTSWRVFRWWFVRKYVSEFDPLNSI